MWKLAGLCWLAMLCGVVCPAAGAEFRDELTQAAEKLQVAQQELEPLIHEGRLAEANGRLLGLFPKPTRTAAQALALGNMFYALDAKLSYTLHAEVARELPDEPYVLMEWAMEQHRAGEHAGALQAYDAYSRANPEYAPVHGLAADCLMRLGRTREASARWTESVKARRGSFEQFESLVCEIYRDFTQEERRVALCEKVATGEVDAAVQLIAMDANYERDWWNAGANRGHLQHDLELLKKLPQNARLKAARCAAEYAMMEEPTADAVRTLFLRKGFLIDPQKTLPDDATTLSIMLGAITGVTIMDREKARQTFGDTLLARARGTTDAEVWNVVAFLHWDSKETMEIEKEGWDATGDARFAASYLEERLRRKTLESDDPLLAKAVRAFPEDAWIAGAALAAAKTADEELLVRAIKAEYRHFSARDNPLGRPSGRSLRQYFARLAQILETNGKK